MQDSTAVLGFVHGDRPAAIWHDDLQALGELTPVLGQFTTLGHFLRDATVGEYGSTATADDFAIDHLDRLVTARHARPVTGIQQHWRLRRRVDAGWTWLALVRSLGGSFAPECVDQLNRFEERVELGEDLSASEVLAAYPK